MSSFNNWAVGGLVLGVVAGCRGIAAPQNGAFAQGDYCDHVVLGAIAEHDELRWEQRHSPLSGGASLDVAEGFTRGETHLPVRQYLRHRAPPSSLGPPSRDDSRVKGEQGDMLVRFHFEPVKESRVRRADGVTRNCKQ